MNIFTNDDYRKIQAWLQANAIKDSDLTSVDDTIPEEDTLVLVQKINGILSSKTLFPGFGALGLISSDGVSPNTFVAVYKVAPIIQILAKPSPNAA